jgi:hypothetical protein
MRPTTFCLAAVAAFALAACGSDQPPAPPTSGQPIQAPKNTWTWVDFPDSSCGDGTATGIGINPGDSPNVLVFLEGGGACSSFGTCRAGFLGATILTDGPFGALEFGILSTTTASGATFQRSVLDRTETANPFRDWSLVYVPYCTGDVHGGDNVASYPDPEGGSRAFHHVGHKNVQAFLRRLTATFPDAPKLAVVGTSAGGFGAFVNYETFRTSWPAAQVYLIDDSGPPLQGSEARAQVDQFDLSWNINQTLDVPCPSCRQDLSNALPALASRHPADRMSLLSYQRDTTIPVFFGIETGMFVERLRATADVIDGGTAPNARYFLFGGTAATGSLEGHTLVRNPDAFMLDGVSLWEFLRQQVNDDPSWISHAEQ